MNYNAEHVKRLELAHKQAILEATKQLKHWEGIKTDYNNLAAKLKTLPDKMSHDIMVPYGPLAFSPGKLIHTNELLVHLGDSWFAEVTCKQGLKIIDHRLAAVDKNIEDIGFTVKNFKKKSEFSQHLNNDGDKSAVEIKEEVSNQYLHPSRRKRISRVKEKPPVRSQEDRNPTKPPIVDEAIKEKCFNDGAFMSRLDELEKFEEEEDRLLLESNLLEDNENPDVRIQTSTSDSKKRVSWSSKVIQGHDADSDDSDDVTNTTTIKFTHTNVTSHPSNSKQQTSGITSPADIGRKTSEPKSILKPATSFGPKSGSNDLNPLLPGPSRKSNITTVSNKIGDRRTAERKFDVAISDYVQEHKETIKQSVVPTKKRPVSKFKSSRIK
ncbi:unconventional prefoldin RPB5 interactor isoform X1 [Ciona intestinalis]